MAPKKKPSLRALVIVGLLGLAGMAYMLWPRAPAIEGSDPLATGASWELRRLEGRAVLTGPTMGTRYSVVLAGDDFEGERLDEVLAAVDAELLQVNLEMSTYLPESELSRFNDGPARRGT